ncbi:MAG: FapA family protein [Lachnospiraceae bacterium]|nr:FapA family protein [Lachnospiraceae bacterium]
MNAYFQIVLNDSGTFLQLIPGDDGSLPSVQEVMNYLDFKKVPFDVAVLGAFFKAGDPEKLIPLSKNRILAVSEGSMIRISEDGMTATARFYPPSTGGRLLNKEEIYSECRLAKVNFGVDEKVLDDFLANKKYCTDYVIAKGVPVKEGKDAWIEYHFNTDNRVRPTLNEDGTVDFFNLNLVNHCTEGMVLATLHPEVKGEAGRDVSGTELAPRNVKPARLSYGLNIQLAEDMCSISSRVNGHVTLTGGKVFVSDVMQVVNVDNSTGNIEYQGNVLVQGNVNSNFSIRCSGDVEVQGVVEGATIEAGGNIVLVRGINGMGKGTLKAGGNIIAKYMENCKAEAGGYVETNSILHSKVQAGTEINVMSKRGFITGGEVMATGKIRVRTLGSQMGADTRVTVGVNPSVVSRIGELNKELQEEQKNLKSALPVLDAFKKKLAAGAKMTPEQVKQVQALAANIKTTQEKIVQDNEELENLKELMQEGSEASVEVKGEAYQGVIIAISDVSMIIKDTVKYCRFVREKGDVRIAAL